MQSQECHICKFKYCQSSSQSGISLPKCCIKRCNKKYCVACIREKFDNSFQEVMYKSDTWICYSCQNLCACMLCKGIGSDKKANKKKGPICKLETKPDHQKQIVVEDYYSTQQMSSAVPFMKRIYERRNNLFKMMANSQSTESGIKTKQAQKQEQISKQEERGTIRVKQQVIKKTLKEYCDDQDDIELIE